MNGIKKYLLLNRFPLKTVVVLSVVLGLFFSSCGRKDCQDPIPVIQFKSFIPNGNAAKLTITFIDCDGDVGLTAGDTTPDFKYNLFLEFFELQNNEWVQFIPDTSIGQVHNYFRTPDLRQKGKHKSIKGDIEVSINQYYNPFSTNTDSIKYSISLKDRALHESNLIFTPAIPSP